MRPRAGLGGLEARIKRLEAATGKGRRNCPHCRLYDKARWPVVPGRDQASKDTVLLECEYCHSEHSASFKGIPDDEREIFRFIGSSTWEDFFADPKAHAAYLWFYYRPSREKAVGQSNIGKEGAKNDPRARRLPKLEAEADRLTDRKIKRLRAKYGEDPFPEHTALIDSVQNRGGRRPDISVPGLVDLEEEETCHLVRAELEKIIVGATRPETAAAVEALRARIEAAISEATEQARLAEEQRVRREEEFLRQNREYGRRTV